MNKIRLLPVAAAFLAAPALAATLTTGVPGGSYHGVFGKNMADLLREQGLHVETAPSGGSEDNIARLAAGEADIGFSQADTWAASGQTQLRVLGTLGQECMYVAVRDGGPIDDEDDLEGRRVAVGGEGSGSAASWHYAQRLQPDYQDTSTHYIGDFEALAAVQTGQVDAFLWVTSPTNLEHDYLQAVQQSEGQLSIIGMDDWGMNDKLPSGTAVYTFQDVDLETGMFADSIETACTDLLVLASPDADADLLRTAARSVMMNSRRIMGQ